MLEINIIDKSPDIASRLKRNCPGLWEIGSENGGGIYKYYSVELFSEINLVCTDSFSEKLNSSERLKRTAHAIIALGSGEADTETAIYLRELFDRVNPPKFESNTPIAENTEIYAVLYDDYLGDGKPQQSRKLINHKETPYNIRFIGGLTAKYSRDTVYSDRLESNAFKEHISWLLEDIAKLSSEEQCKEVVEQILSYERFEYFRLSSISKALYFEKSLKPWLGDISDAERSEWLKNNEHNRWILYMCANGYIYSKEHSDRAKTHNDIVHFNELTENEKCKDRYANNKTNGGT